MNSDLIYRNRRYTIEELDIIPGTNQGFAFARNSRQELVALTVIVKDGQIIQAATKHEPWEDVA